MYIGRIVSSVIVNKTPCEVNPSKSKKEQYPTKLSQILKVIQNISPICSPVQRVDRSKWKKMEINYKLHITT